MSTLGRLQEIQIARVPWNNRLFEESEDRVECHCKKKAARWTALSYTPGHEELSPSCSGEFHVRDAVVKILRTKRQINSGNSVFSITERIQE